MKKVAAILLVVIHLFNVTGVRLTLEYMLHQSNVKFEKQLDTGDYNKENLVEIKIPLSNPYYSSTPVYERYYGEFNYDGQYYNYVMRKIQNDTVYLLCINNSNKTELNKSKTEFASMLSGQEGFAKTKKGIEHNQKKQDTVTEYINQNNRFDLSGLEQSLSVISNAFTSNIIKLPIDSPFRPPDQGLSAVET